MVLDKKNIHFVGIGGIGMSGIARVLLEMGYKVSGSDTELSDITKRLESMGGRVFKGHSPSNISKDVEVLVYSSSIVKDNPELEEARRRKIRVIHRAEVLGELFNNKKGIAVTGTHGKTTTTSLISVMLKNSNMDPTVIIGGEVRQFKGNAKLGNGPYLVAEADESDSSFLHLRPLYAVITNIEMEHLDHYKTLDDIKASYRSFVGNLKDGGAVFYNQGDANAKDILKDFHGDSESFGLSQDADIYPIAVKMVGFSTTFKCIYKNKLLGKVTLNIPGMHNVLNALATILIGLGLGLDFNAIASSIKNFEGARRRFQLRYSSGGIMLIDDYAHHPTEIRAVLDTCKNWKNKRLVVIFQPHRYTRTKFLADDFGRCFEGVNKLILTDIYAASEKPIKGVSIKNICDKVRANGIADVAIVDKNDIAEYVIRLKRRGDMIVVLGAGDIKKAADDICEKLERRTLDKKLISELKRSAKGQVRVEEPIAPHTSFRIGGASSIWVEPADIADLKRILMFARTHKIPVFVIGNGTNLLVSDSGFNGMMIHLGSPFFKSVRIKGETVRVGAGFSLPKLIKLCCDKALSGLESLVGIPGTVGGAIYMNAGGSANPIYKNIGEVAASLKVMDYSGKIKRLKGEDVKFGYRRSNLDGYIILEAALKLKKHHKDVLNLSCTQFMAIKREKQVLDMPSAGCIFKNPSNFQFTCGQMIDMLGLKGKRMGGAEISPKHANFIVNKDNATCKDVLALAEFIKKKVKENYNIPLEMEVKVI